ncbi:MAG: hypothetical protein L3J25_07225 [Flavobacteriaceae bacterium]|nr:hypothetical protein [Flavobacteriaceae bacterium]
MKKLLKIVGILLVVGIVGIYYALKTGYIDTKDIEIIEDIKIEPLFKPKPEVISSFSNTDKTNLLSGICTVHGVIKNNGGTGFIDIEVKLHQKNKTYYREYKQRTIKKNGTLEINVDFKEYNRYKGKYREEIIVKPSIKQPSPAEIRKWEEKQ